MPYLRGNDRNLELLKAMFQRRMERRRGASPLLSPEPEELYAALEEPEEEPVRRPKPQQTPRPEAQEPEAEEEPYDFGTNRSEAHPKPKPMMSMRRVTPHKGGSNFVQGMIKRGWTPEEAAGAAGNVHVESGFDPGIKSKAPGENSYGYLQWNKERLAGLKNMAVRTGRDWTDPETQMDWIHMERTGESVKYGGGDERTAYKKGLAAGTPEEIAERFGQHVERPADLSHSVAVRRAAARRYSLQSPKPEAKPAPAWEAPTPATLSSDVYNLVMRTG